MWVCIECLPRNWLESIVRSHRLNWRLRERKKKTHSFDDVECPFLPIRFERPKFHIIFVIGRSFSSNSPTDSTFFTATPIKIFMKIVNFCMRSIFFSISSEQITCSSNNLHFAFFALRAAAILFFHTDFKFRRNTNVCKWNFLCVWFVVSESSEFSARGDWFIIVVSVELLTTILLPILWQIGFLANLHGGKPQKSTSF